MSQTTFSRAFNAFCLQGKALRGVHPIITQAFYPYYKYEQAIYGPASAHTSSNKHALTRFKPGMRTGTLLDNELKRTIKLCRKYDLPASAFVSHERQVAHANRIGVTKADMLLFKKKSSIATLRVWQTFVKLNLKPLRAQVPVGDLNLKAGTGVDVECVDEFNCKVVIDTKLGFQAYYHKHTGHMLKSILPQQTDCPANQHQLQLLVTFELYRLAHPGAKMGPAYIFRVDAFGVEVIPMQGWVKTNASSIFKIIKALH